MFTKLQMRSTLFVSSALLIFIVVGASVSTDWKYRAISGALMLLLIFAMAFVAANTNDEPKQCVSCGEKHMAEYADPIEKDVCVFCAYQDGGV